MIARRCLAVFIAAFVVIALLAVLPARGDSLISADFDNAHVLSATYAGVEPLAKLANPVFGAANIWNSVQFGYLSPINDPSFSGLKDSNGNTTSVGLSFTGPVDSYTGTDNPNDLFREFIYLNSGSTPWKITGLIPGDHASVYFYDYGDAGQPGRAFTMLMDEDGNGSLEASVTVDAATGGYVPGVVVNASGEINGEMLGNPGQSSWSGFQVAVPEPNALIVLMLGGVGWIGRRRVAGVRR